MAVAGCNGAVQTTTPRDDGATVKPDTKAPGKDASAPKVDATIPGKDASTPNADAATPTHDASTPKADASAADTGPKWPLPDGSLLLPDALPACSWPASLNRPDAAAGGDIAWDVSRALVVGACCFNDYHENIDCSDYLLGQKMTTCEIPSCGPCVMGCEPDQYVVREYNCGDPSYQDALVYPTLPAGCSGLMPGVQDALFNVTTACLHNTYYCCPCQ